MIKLVTFFKRKTGLSPEAFQAEWRGAHVAKALAIPGLRGYVQSHVLLSGTAKASPSATASPRYGSTTEAR